MTHDPRDAYRRATELDPTTARHLRQRTREHIAAASPARLGRAAPWIAAVAVLALLVGLATRIPREDASAPATLPIPYVTLDMGGVGAIAGTETEPVVDWSEGSLAVAVTPHKGVHLTVSTPEATVRVVGTVFTVDRLHRATRVAVTEGTVHVTCTSGTEVAVTAGANRTCLPSDPASLLMRLAELNRAGASPAERLETATAGLDAVTASSPLRPELLAHRIRALVDAGRIDEALASAADYLSATAAGPRRDELVSFVARTRYEREGCGAVDALERAVRTLPPGPESILLASCLVETDPARAAALVDTAPGWAAGEWLRAAEELRARLGASP